MPTILVIDDNPGVATALEVLFSLHDITTLAASNPRAGLKLLDEQPVDMVVQDMNFSGDTTSGQEGEALYSAIRAQHPDLPVILLTAWTHLESAVGLIKAGAADYVAKPWSDERLVTVVRNLVELGSANRALRERAQRDARGRRQLQEQFDTRGMVWRECVRTARWTRRGIPHPCCSRA